MSDKNNIIDINTRLPTKEKKVFDIKDQYKRIQECNERKKNQGVCRCKYCNFVHDMSLQLFQSIIDAIKYKATTHSHPLNLTNHDAHMVVALVQQHLNNFEQTISSKLRGGLYGEQQTLSETKSEERGDGKGYDSKSEIQKPSTDETLKDGKTGNPKDEGPFGDDPD